MTDDRVDRLVGDLGRLRPDMDLQTKAVAARLLHLSDLVQRYYGAVADRFGISLSGVAVLTTLARHAPKPLTLTEINRDILVTSGGITFVIARLQSQRLLTKKPHPDDGRAFLVGLTRRGQQLASQVIEAVAAADVAALGQLDADDLAHADRILRDVQTGIDSALAVSTGVRRTATRGGGSKA